ncbi:hypothetical protein Bca4012_071897 [Brassica carinata]
MSSTFVVNTPPHQNPTSTIFFYTFLPPLIVIFVFLLFFTFAFFSVIKSSSLPSFLLVPKSSP